MFSATDLVLIIAGFCLLVITIVLVVIGVQFVQILGDIRSITREIQNMNTLLAKIGQIAFPAIERLVSRADLLERKVEKFVEKKVEHLTKG